jgi:threonine/homoserine/homoserine lactone efflux protein
MVCFRLFIRFSAIFIDFRSKEGFQSVRLIFFAGNLPRMVNTKSLKKGNCRDLNQPQIEAGGLILNDFLQEYESMTLFEVFIQSFILALSGALAPGPLLTYDIQLAYKKGFWVGPQLILGHAILELVLIVGLIAGLGKFIQLPVTQIILGIFGGLLLLWMGYDLIWAESKKSIVAVKEQAATNEKTAVLSNMNPVAAGFIISLSNPYFLIWWAVIGLGIMTKSLTLGWTGIVVFFCAHELVDLSWYTMISAAISTGRELISKGIYRWLLIICGIFLIFLAGKFLYDALGLLGVIQWFQQQTIDLFGRFHKFV